MERLTRSSTKIVGMKSNERNTCPCRSVINLLVMDSSGGALDESENSNSSVIPVLLDN